MSLVRELREVTTGIYVLTTREGEVRHGMSSSWVTPVSGEPPLLGVSVDLDHVTHGRIERTGCFGLNVVGRSSRRIEDHFFSTEARRDDNLGPFEVVDSPAGVPLLEDCPVGFECRVRSSHVAGDHRIFIASIEWVRTGEPDEVLTSNDLPYVYLGNGRIVSRRD